MLIGAIASFVLAALMAALVAGGLCHARRTAAEKQMLVAPGVVTA
jgi:hypothetical protein